MKEADDATQQIQKKFGQLISRESLIGGFSAALTGICFIATYYSLKKESPYAYLCGALTCLSGFTSLNALSDVSNAQQFANRLILNQDTIYQQKMKHLHTRHMLTDLARSQLARLEEIMSLFFSRLSAPEKQEPVTTQS